MKSNKNLQENSIATIRTERGLTQPELASALNVSIKTLWNWEHGKPMSLEKAFAIAQELDCSLSDLFPGNEKQLTN